ncbi:ATP-dependent DNA/RNA helicase DHX36 [Belonocnema kinseyi]|uniref:ATP-dependent DNA/RNA helicase DHX36 n=1 Tax=Belonocnema kinseyi TaxID=2817044 RepID=UPI00143D2095|nr:ATP-dependent DNA/RNA helicase DHX36 [Belonocnema kinseyi]XP_033228402.1 ATP-dependent DNA/RNA helicase DHX36 [Belonocnema kinseyi]
MSNYNGKFRHGTSRGRGRGGGGGHPPGLKGKEIGLYYRDKAKLNKSRRNEVNTNTVRLNIDIERRIRSLIDFQSSDYTRQSAARANSSATDQSFDSAYNNITDSHFKQKFLRILSGNMQANLVNSIRTMSKWKRNELLDENLVQERSKMLTSQQYISMLNFRAKLPAFNKREEILDLLERHQVIVISGETGCGKTTQVPQFILDNEIEQRNGSITKIVCTQPRRISAISVAERVAAERGESVGHSVGYQIRLERVQSRSQGCILFCTTGMLLQFMQKDPALTDVSHIVLDEIHERNTESDFIISLLKKVIPKRPDLKVILMSATLNSEQFSRYYDNCPTIHIPGFTYPVQEFYLEDVLSLTRFRFPMDTKNNDRRLHYKKYIKKHRHQAEESQSNHSVFIEPYLRHLESQGKYAQFVLNELRNPKSEELSLELVEELVRYICTSKDAGAILVFLPGLMDITKLNKMMLESGRYPRDRYVIYPLHSRMPTVDQKLIFEIPAHGVRKIIISTSIAETSITIEDVVYVIDCGKTKLSRFDLENNVQTLLPEWITVANAQQRRGRAGRVKPGICYHLYTKACEHMFDHYPLPEMLRSRLDEVILQIKILQLGKADPFLASVMDPPDPKAIELSLDLLRKLNALDMNENLTPLGYHLAQLPLDPRTGKMIIWAALFSCIEPVFAIAASLSFKDAFYCPLDREDEARRKKLELGMGQFSDHLALAEALRRFEHSSFRNKHQTASFCREYFLSWNTLRLLSDMKSQFARNLCEMKFLQNDNPSDMNANRNSNNLSLIKAIVCAGLYPNIAVVRGITKHNILVYTPEDGRVKIHPSSINEKIRSLPSPYLIYFLKKRSTAIYLHDTTSVSPWALLFTNPNRFAGEREGKSIITLSDSLSFYCEPTTAQIIQRLRDKLDAILEHKITHPGSVNWDSQEGRILTAIIQLLSQGDQEMGLESGMYHVLGEYDGVDYCNSDQD